MGELVIVNHTPVQVFELSKILLNCSPVHSTFGDDSYNSKDYRGNS